MLSYRKNESRREEARAAARELPLPKQAVRLEARPSERGEIGFIVAIRLFSGVVSVIAYQKPHQFLPGWYYFVQKTKFY